MSFSISSFFDVRGVQSVRMLSLTSPLAAGFFLLLTMFFLVAPTQAAPSYKITTFNLTGGFEYEASYAYGMNTAGEVVGSGGSDIDGYAPFIYSGGAVTTLPATSFFDSANAINDNGLIVGSVDFVPSRYIVISGTWTPLSTDPNATDVYAVNNAGVSVGQWFTLNSERQAIRYNADGSVTKLGTLRADDSGTSCAAAINASGTMAGCSETEDGGIHAVIFDTNGMIIDLGSMAGPAGYSEGYGINDLGQVVGAGDNADGDYRGFIWTNGVFQEIGVLAGYEYSEAFGINNLGHAVGRIATNAGDLNSAFFYDGLTLYDLATLVQGGLAAAGIDYLFDATGINDAGQIVGNAFDFSGNRVGILLTAVPEPSTAALFALGLMFFFRQRRAFIPF